MWPVFQGPSGTRGPDDPDGQAGPGATGGPDDSDGSAGSGVRGNPGP